MRKKQSEIISEFIKLTGKTIDIYNAAYEAVNTEDKLTSDLLHEMELEGRTSKIRSKIATKLRESRLDRRYYKDIVEELDPLFLFLDDPENRRAIKRLEQVLGKMRKAEAYHADRIYHPRVNRLDKED